MYWTLADLHPELFKLYAGPDAEASFNSLTCTRCTRLAFDPSECTSCRRLVCYECRHSAAKGQNRNICTECKSELSHPNDVHFLAKQVLQNATFRCPYSCPEAHIPMNQLEPHVQKYCAEAFTDCPNKCGKRPHIRDVKEHRKACTHEPVVCD